jgi:hypothetical protein
MFRHRQMTQCGASRVHRAGAGNLTYIVGCVERRFARQRGIGSVCDEDLSITVRIARSTPGSAFKKTGAPSGTSVENHEWMEGDIGA